MLTLLSTKDKHKPVHIDLPKQECPYRALWSAVLMQAIEDAGLVPRGPTTKPITATHYGAEKSRQSKINVRHWECHSARQWLLKDTKTFYFVCESAGVNPDIVRRMAQTRIEAEKSE